MIFEDIIAVVDGRPEIVGEIAEAEPTIREYIATEIGALLENEDFVEALSGFLLPDAASQAPLLNSGSELSRVRHIETPLMLNQPGRLSQSVLNSNDTNANFAVATNNTDIKGWAQFWAQSTSLRRILIENTERMRGAFDQQPSGVSSEDR